MSCNTDGTGEVSDACPFGCNPNEKRCADKPGPVCTANQGLRCDGANLVRCNGDGTGEASPQPCALGCDSAGKRCYDMEPSNGLGRFFAQAGSALDLDLGESATINTDTGDVAVGSMPVDVRSDTQAQSGAPTIRVLIVRSLVAKNVVVTGRNALAVVSSGDITIKDGGLFAAVASALPAPGAMTEPSCQGEAEVIKPGVASGGGGGGFGSAGGRGGSATSGPNSARGGGGGGVTGNALLVPLRGGCNGGGGLGGGAIQLVSGSQVLVVGVIATNGERGRGGGSGGGILVEAPLVNVPGRIIANGGSGSGGGIVYPGELTHFDATQSLGGIAPPEELGDGGKGGAGNSGATDGETISNSFFAWAGSGGGGYGRIRINTAPGGQRGGDGSIYSPTPVFGSLSVR